MTATRPPLPGPVTWMVLPPSRPVLAHLFVVGNEVSCCGRVRLASCVGIAPRGRRGCRPCARNAGVTGTLSQVVTT